MEYRGDGLTCSLERRSYKLCMARVVVKQPFVSALYKQALTRHQLYVQARGFARGTTPISYIERTYKSYIVEHLKEFLLNHCVVNFLCQELHRQRVVVVGDPQLQEVSLEPSGDAEFIFSCAQLTIPSEADWRKIHFKIPNRRNYKDLDRQVELFIRDEEALGKTAPNPHPITIGDWICFSIAVVDHEDRKRLIDFEDILWLKIGREDTDKEAQKLFCGKASQDSFVTSSDFFQRYFSKQLDTDYTFLVTILNVIPANFFSFDALRHHFGLKQNDSINRALMGVFSSRHDISLRRELVEATFRALFKRFPVWLPEELVKQQEEYLLREVQRTPDYPVYRLQKDFRTKISVLAEKQLREALITDFLAHREEVKMDSADISAYFALLQRPRTKEFIYFDLPVTQVNGQEQPLPLGIVQQACLREKMLNRIIFTLT